MRFFWSAEVTLSGIGRKLVFTKMETSERSVFKSNVWTYLGFFNREGKTDMDMTHAICKEYRM